MIIPGVTVPLSHTPLILTALFLSQLIHELGHALSAALESVPLLSVGASFTLMLPAAHVALSTPMYAALDARKRGRVTSPLAAHLIPGITTITALDDTPMSSTDVWEAHLKAQPGLPEKGWCVPKPDFVAPDICCHPSQTHSSYCFHIHPSPAPRPLGCADPVGIITNTTLVRCR
ncbi:hypothetical protein FA13DRAFT_1796717 [Coprinellus micaceus]|uniref:Endopeptidase S2P n=1 Tax=Coprinellus micaceus TaxID=71717 RepID=A0A4Y7ST32_COPMI|nr:hypothetical protein FA13DRAFT_1796717 [Coprinellus micaceus]